MENVLKAAKEALEEKYVLKAMGYDIDRAILRIAEVIGMTPEQVTAFGKSSQTVKAGSLLSFWAHRKLEMSTIEIAAKLKISQPAVTRSSKRGESIERENKVELIVENQIKT